MSQASRVYEIVIADFRLTGGMDRANYALAAHLLNRGDAVHLVAHAAAAALRDHPRASYHPVARPLRSDLLGEPLLDRAGRRVARDLRPQNPHVIVNGGNCLWPDVNWVHYVHAAYAPEVRTGRLRRLKNAAARARFLRSERLALQQARLVLANSERTRTDLVELLQIPPERIRVVYYGIDPERFGPIAEADRRAARDALGWTDDRPVVAFVGALGDRRKGFDTLFDAWTALARESSWDARLVVVGSGAEQAVWKGRAEAAGFADRVEFLGFRKDVPAILAASDAMVHPARYEAFGLGVLEALSRGLPVVVSAGAGVAELYPETLRDFLLDDPDSAASLARTLRAWRSDLPAARARFASLGDTLRLRTWDHMAAEIVRHVEA